MAKSKPEIQKPKLEPPSMFAVVLLDDDYTPYDWVVNIIEGLFHKSNLDALRIAREIDETGSAKIGIYTYDVAETKCVVVHQTSQQAGYPLRARVERQ